jgi:hypothetical protein
MPVGVLADEHRGTGRTTRQLEQCQDGYLFVWCTSDLNYVYQLCVKIGGRINVTQSIWTKTDGSKVRIDRASVLTDRSQADKYHGYEFTGLTVDHALEGANYACAQLLLSRVRKSLDTNHQRG